MQFEQSATIHFVPAGTLPHDHAGLYRKPPNVTQWLRRRPRHDRQIFQAERLRPRQDNMGRPRLGQIRRDVLVDSRLGVSSRHDH